MCALTPAWSQDLPEQMYFSDDGRMLLTGGVEYQGFYEQDQVKNLYLEFHDPGYWQFMIDNFGTENYALATLSYDGEELDSVAVSFKGQTSYQKALKSESEKLSFSIKLDEYVDGQDIDGYNNLNLNNAFEDNSFMREVLYGNLSGLLVPALKGNYVRLWLNGEDWGLYPNIQQLNGDFIKEWFPENDGIRWRADSPANDLPDQMQTADIQAPTPPRPGGGGGGQWGDGTAALNYLGEDTASYQQYYTLKDTDMYDPWPYLVRVCRVLNETALDELKDSLDQYLDIDATLWFLAQEILFSDDDSYVYKGKMDYYLFIDAITGRMQPLEFDGNSAMGTKNVGWSLFMNEDDANYPLLNCLLAIPELRQRYIAHARVMLDKAFDEAVYGPLIDELDALISGHVASDPKSTVTTSLYDDAVTQLRSYMEDRKSNLLSNAGLRANAPVIADAEQWSAGEEGRAPEAGETSTIRVTATHPAGLTGMFLYYSSGLKGSFQSVEMQDDGQGPDDTAGDGIYSGDIPSFPAGTLVRYYVEARAGNATQTAAFMPEGAEYDVYVYRVSYGQSDVNGLVINELLASNDWIVADEAGDYDDWVEIHNSSAQDISLEGICLSDNILETGLWCFPDTLIRAGEYMVVWTDSDEEQGSLHASFKLSSGGEAVILSDAEGNIIDQVIFGTQETDISFGRWPDATGDFTSMTPTFQATNSWELTGVAERESEKEFLVYPNPCRDVVYIAGAGAGADSAADVGEGILTITNTMGQVVLEEVISESIDVSRLPAGMYILRCGSHTALLQKH